MDRVTTPPRVLVTRAEDVTGERWQDYADAVERAGGEPFALDVLGGIDIAALPPHAGVLLTAGIDVDPARYGEPRSERVAEVNPARDAAEEALIAHALDDGLPLLCICRGHQLLNTARGGSLLQHLEEREPHRARRGEDGGIASGWHEISVAPGTLLARITGGASTLSVNSRHHQAVTADRVAPGLIASAQTADGVIEALEAPGARWALGVQWHPERAEMAADPAYHAASAALFTAFVAACAEARPQ
ncbi:MAG: gamma-glutamyl-gamma-aminobutyrate hydrolase family protein [Dehalococcoidia bacterium]